MDMTTGKMLNDFTGHVNSSYRCRACFGQAEASVVCGDEKGMVWAWDLLDVSGQGFVLSSFLTILFQGKPFQPNPPPKAHDKVITWTEHHPTDAEMITASGDGTVKVWRHPGGGE
jgi:mitogen-activated protein kinase organizer 1